MAIAFTKKLREKEKATGCGLFAVAVSVPSYGAECMGPMEPEHASKLFLFASQLYKTKDPQKAFDESFGTGKK